MKTTYDASVDAAHIYFADTMPPGLIDRCTILGLPTPLATVGADLSQDGIILRLELLGVSHLLPSSAVSHDALSGCTLHREPEAGVLRLDLLDTSSVASPTRGVRTRFIQEAPEVEARLDGHGFLISLRFLDAQHQLPADAIAAALAE